MANQFHYSYKDGDHCYTNEAVSKYTSEWLTSDISSRILTGDHWDIFGPLQLSFMQSEGLLPHHKLLDVGCGCFRGGISFIPYLTQNNYYGLDINDRFLENGYKNEIERLHLETKFPKRNVVVTDQFDATVFSEMFDYAFSLSLWTHLSYPIIDDCLKNIMKVLKPGGSYYTTAFIVPESVYNSICYHKSELPEDNGLIINTHPNKDCYHFTEAHMTALAEKYNLQYRRIPWNVWGMKRRHEMLVFTKSF